MIAEEQVLIEPKPEAAVQERPLTQAVGKAVLASIGAVALGKDALDSALTRMITRGEQSRKETRRRMNQLGAKRPDISRRGVHNLTDSVREAAELPSKTDIQGLHDQIAALSAKVDRIASEKPEPIAPPPPKASTKP